MINRKLRGENLSENNLRALMAAYPKDGREATNYYLKQNAQKYYSAGQILPKIFLIPLHGQSLSKPGNAVISKKITLIS